MYGFVWGTEKVQNVGKRQCMNTKQYKIMRRFWDLDLGGEKKQKKIDYLVSLDERGNLNISYKEKLMFIRKKKITNASLKIICVNWRLTCPHTCFPPELTSPTLKYTGAIYRWLWFNGKHRPIREPAANDRDHSNKVSPFSTINPFI